MTSVRDRRPPHHEGFRSLRLGLSPPPDLRSTAICLAARTPGRADGPTEGPTEGPTDGPTGRPDRQADRPMPAQALAPVLAPAPAPVRARHGSSAVTRVGPPTGESSTNSPSTDPSRSASPVIPLPPSSRAPPFPSSDTWISSRSPARRPSPPLSAAPVGPPP